MFKLSGYLFLFILLSIFCAGCGEDGVISPTVPAPVTTEDEQIDSTLTETNEYDSMISSTNGGNMIYGDLELEFEPGDMPYDSDIEIAEVTIQDDSGLVFKSKESGSGPIYKISSNSPDEEIILNDPVKIKFKIDPSSPAPYLAFWSGDEWLPLDEEYVTYDETNHTLITYLNSIDEDDNEWAITGTTGSVLESPTVVTFFPNINESTELNNNFPYRISSKNENFSVHYTKDVTNAQAKKLGDALDDCLNFYTNLDYPAPITFKYTQDEETSISKRIMVYFRTDKKTTAWASPDGIILMPLPDEDMTGTAYHELFHLVQFAYSKRGNFDTWFGENTADSMGPCAYNALHTTTEPKRLDYPGEQTHWNGADHFSYSLNLTGDDKEYENAVIWCYFLKVFGTSSYRDLVRETFSNNPNKISLQTMNTRFNASMDKPLTAAYFEAFEDFFIYGKVYNKTYFNNLPERDPNEPFCDPSSGYSNKYNYNSASGTNNPYYSKKAITLQYLSGRYFNFSSNEKAESLYLTVSPSNKSNFKFKLYYFKNDNGSRVLSDTKEYANQAVSNLEIPYDNGVTDISILLENLSLDTNNTIQLQIYGR